MSRFRIRARAWAASVAMVAAVGLAACSGDDDGLTTEAAPAQPATSARLRGHAEQIERSAHLEGQARTHGGAAVPANPDANQQSASASVGRHLAEQIERQASLDGQAKTFSDTRDPEAR
jgi:hypothetical protein